MPGRDLSDALLEAESAAGAGPVLFMTDDEISEGSDLSKKVSPQGIARAIRLYSTIEQPNHIETVVAEVETGGEQHLVKLSRYHDNPQFWTVPGERDERIRGRKTITVTEPEPDQYEMYDLTADPFEERNLAHPAYADEKSRSLQSSMLELLIEELDSKRLTPADGGPPGYRPPSSTGTGRRQGVATPSWHCSSTSRSREARRSRILSGRPAHLARSQVFAAGRRGRKGDDIVRRWQDVQAGRRHRRTSGSFRLGRWDGPRSGRRRPCVFFV